MAHILVADDEEDIVELLRVALEGNGHRVTAVYNGDEVLKALEAAPCDVVLMDIMLPGRDGYNLQIELSAHERFKNIPVIVITALEPARVLFEKFSQVKAYVTKPFDPHIIIDKVNEILAGT